MRSLWLGCAALVGLGLWAACGGDASSAAFSAYDKHATAEVMGEHSAAAAVVGRFGGQTTDIVGVSHELESQEVLDDAEVELIVLQSVRWKWNQPGPSRVQTRRARHYVTMARGGSSWQVASVETEDLD
jgi:hypothetical protein